MVIDEIGNRIIVGSLPAEKECRSVVYTAAVLKYSLDGTLLWSIPFTSTKNFPHLASVDVTDDGLIVVAGHGQFINDVTIAGQTVLKERK